MWEIILAAGWPIWPLIFASIIALAIIGERFWSLRVEIIAPSDLLPEVQNLLNQGTIKKDVIAKIKEHSLLGEIFASALDHLKIIQLFAVIGGSVGGGLAWELAALKPTLIEHLIPIASDWKSTDWLIANCYIQEQILNNSSQPLVDARMHAMSLYRTPESFKAKFDRILQKDENVFAVESWLNYHGNVLNERFQLAAYKMMNQVLKTIDITNRRGSFIEVASQIKSNIHIVTINSDFVFVKYLECHATISPSQSKEGPDKVLDAACACVIDATISLLVQTPLLDLRPRN